jgi:predicted AAA+ superfamily ATPase
MFVKRTLAKSIENTTKTFPIVMLTGPRQVGKTTLLEKCAETSMTYVSLDNMADRQLAQEDPALFLQRYAPPVLIDEIRYAPGLFPYIKMEVDRSRRPGQFWLTGSQQFHLMRNVSESLAGRVAILRLLGLSFAEQNDRAEQAKPFLPTQEFLREREKLSPPPSLLEVYKTIWTGSFPAIALHPEVNRDVFYNSYLQTYVERDVRDLARVGDERSFVRFVRAAAARTGQLLNMAGPSQGCRRRPQDGQSMAIHSRNFWPHLLIGTISH